MTEKVKGTAAPSGSIGKEAAIHKEQQKIHQCYVRIGKQFVRGLAGNAVPEQYQELCRLILESEHRVKDLKVRETTAQLAAASYSEKGKQSAIVTCPKCGAIVESGNAFCSSCGQQLA